MTKHSTDITNTAWNKLTIVFQAILGVIYATTGISKLVPGFPNIIGPVWLIDRLAEHGLGLFGVFIAISQFVVGFLILIPATRLVGAIAMLPMHLCILIVPISLG